MENENANARLIPFLRNLANSIEEKKLLPQQLERIGEFFMAYQFQEQAIRSDTTPEPTRRNHEFTPEELMKFFVMGWYVYCVLLVGDHLSTNND